MLKVFKNIKLNSNKNENLNANLLELEWKGMLRA